MNFSLTDELIDSIISAMENQEKVFAVNAAENQLVEVQKKSDADFFVDEEKFAIVVNNMLCLSGNQQMVLKCVRPL